MCWKKQNRGNQAFGFWNLTNLNLLLFLEHASQLNFQLANDVDVQRNFDKLYDLMLNLLNHFYPKREITVTSSDPHYVTAVVKAMLRCKNRLMRAGRTEEADALALRICTAITRRNTKWLQSIDTRTHAKGAWSKVREITHGEGKRNSPVNSLTAQVLNDHYVAISTDTKYQPTLSKLTAHGQISFISDVDVFRQLDHLHPTATGLDDIQAWFLRLGMPIFSASIAQIFNQSVVEGVVPRQWKTAIISPVPKVSIPSKPSDYRPISITPVLSRCLEKHVLHSYIYPALHLPHPGLRFDDQFAFRPSGSTTAAVVALLHTLRLLLSSSQFVRVFSFDFTKAFDTVRHAAVMTKMAQLQIPDCVYNWIKAFFDEHFHCTRYAGQCSKVAEVKASVI